MDAPFLAPKKEIFTAPECVSRPPAALPRTGAFHARHTTPAVNIA